MAAPKTVLTYPLNGTDKNFTVPFEYLARKFVAVTLIGSNRRVLVLSTEYRFTTKTQITTTTAWGPAQGYEQIEIRRMTSATERLVDFSDGSILRAYDLNTAQVQSLHIAEEARDLTADTIGVNNDGNLDARGKRISNVADAVLPGDTITLRQVTAWNDSALVSKNAAKVSETNAKTSETNATNRAAAALVSQNAAKTSETNAKTSETNAKASEVAAKASQTAAASSATSASSSATSAATSASTATTQADRAKIEADKLGNANTFMSSLESVNTGTKVIQWNDGWALSSDKAYVGAGVAPLVLSETGISRQGSYTISSTGANLIIENTGGPLITRGSTSASMQASTGMIDMYLPGAPGSQALRLIAEYPIQHFRSSGKMHAYFQAQGTGVFNIAVYDPTGAVPRVFGFSSTGSFAASGTLSGAGLTLGTGSVAAVGGVAMVIAKSSAWINFVASGASPSGRNRMTHGLGREALAFQLQYKCVVAEAGYAVGDIVSPVDMNYQSSTTTTRGGQLILVDNNTVDYFCGGTGVVLINKTTGVATTMTIANWLCRVTAMGIANG